MQKKNVQTYSNREEKPLGLSASDIARRLKLSNGAHLAYYIRTGRMPEPDLTWGKLKFYSPKLVKEIDATWAIIQAAKPKN